MVSQARLRASIAARLTKGRVDAERRDIIQSLYARTPSALLVTALCIAIGCAPGAQTYSSAAQPSESPADAEARIQVLLNQALAPQMQDVRVESDALTFQCWEAAVREHALSSSSRAQILLRCPSPYVHIPIATIASIDIAQPQHYLTFKDASGRTILTLRPRTNPESLALVNALRVTRDQIAQRSADALPPLDVRYTRHRFGAR